tara:strand:+ start:1168 stop:2010 length:843 start_codon:yes stop_codon:yes gene_type:complete
MINHRHWSLAVIIAITLHMLMFGAFLSLQSAQAKDKGENGIEIDLGMLGDLGIAELSEETAVEEAVEQEIIKPEPIKDVVEEVKKPIEKVVPKPEVKQPLPKLTKTNVTSSEVQVNSTPRKLEKAVVETPEPVKKETKEVENITPNTSVKPTQVKAETTQVATQKKRSTGQSSAVTAGGNPSADKSYFSLLASHLIKYKRYPNRSRKNNEEGVVTVFFIVNRAGKISDLKIIKSSGFKNLDEAVLRMVRKASPLPKFPDDLSKPTLSISIPIEFKLEHST